MSLGAVQMLQKSLEDAQKNLSQTNDAIQRLTGRDVSKPLPPPQRRMSGSNRMRGWSEDFPPAKRWAESVKTESNNTPSRRLSGRIGEREGERESRDGEREVRVGEGGRIGERERRISEREGRIGEREGRFGQREGRLSDRIGDRIGQREGRMNDRIGQRDGRIGNRDGRAGDRDGNMSEGEIFNNNSDEEDVAVDKPIVQSSVTAAPIPPRPTADVTETKKSKSRNRRMFGMLMGTLQKFQEDSARTTVQEKRRAEIEEKIEQATIKEKEEASKERKGLYLQRRSQRQKVGLLADHVALAEMYEEWNIHDKRLLSYIKTRSKPPIYYLPVQHNEKTEALLKKSQGVIEEKIKERTVEVEQLLSDLTSAAEDPAPNQPQETPTDQPIQIESDITFKRERYETDSDMSDQDEQ